MLTETQKTDIAELVQKILDTDIPDEVREMIFNAFFHWPDGPDDGGNNYDGYDALDIVNHVKYPSWLG